MAKEKCFIIAPISTLTERVSLYLNDTDHCEHVIDHLLVPAVEKAGFEPVKPKVKGANLIHVEIVRNLQTAALVLCDMSGLNPNVFFELGIRTAMNKPICLTIDQATKDPPFDLDLINHHAYVSDLRPWVLPREVEKLTAHVRESATATENALWKYFALRFTADTAERRPGPGDKMDLILSEIDALRKVVAATEKSRIYDRFHAEIASNLRAREHLYLARDTAIQAVITKAKDLLGFKFLEYADKDGNIDLWIGGSASHKLLTELTSFAKTLGVPISIRVVDEPTPGRKVPERGSGTV